jgi:hypothetical protein
MFNEMYDTQMQLNPAKAVLKQELATVAIEASFNAVRSK